MFVRRIESFLPWAAFKLKVPFFSPAKIELQITASNHGDFFCAHQDNSHAGECRTRALTFVYYLNPSASAFEGGRLLLHPGGQRDGAGNGTVKIVPAPNTVVFFPSGVLHEIEPVVCRTGAFGDSRFTVNGWFHDADNAPSETATNPDSLRPA
jgi:Rps23 Pro-64 3,4-dihydroxylase Tpa1-like proline 4-hydroxylase